MNENNTTIVSFKSKPKKKIAVLHFLVVYLCHCLRHTCVYRASSSEQHIWSFFVKQQNWYTYVLYKLMYKTYSRKMFFHFKKHSRYLWVSFKLEFSVEFWRFSKIDVLFGKWRRKPTVTIFFFFYFILQPTYSNMCALWIIFAIFFL